METGVGDTQFLIDLKSFKIGFKLKPIWKKMLSWINFFVSPCFSWKPKTDVRHWHDRAVTISLLKHVHSVLLKTRPETILKILVLC